MKTTIRNLAAGLLLLSALGTANAWAQSTRVSPQGLTLAATLDKLGVETKWIAGAHVDWRTGEPDGRPVSGRGAHTHCSAFVAAAAETLGIYILRPPEHGQTLLANAQNEWLADDGADEGWRPLDGPEAAQSAANSGMLVVASYHNHRDSKPGHIAIVRPSEKSLEQIAAEGPDVIQAGTVNSASISLKAGFAGHSAAWNNEEVDFYKHAIPRTASPRPQ